MPLLKAAMKSLVVTKECLNMLLYIQLLIQTLINAICKQEIIIASALPKKLKLDELFKTNSSKIKIPH